MLRPGSTPQSGPRSISGPRRRGPLWRRPRALLTALAVACVTIGGVAGVAWASSALHDPFGVLDPIAQTGTGVTVSGWAIDRDTGAPLSVAITVNGTTAATTTAGLPRTDLGSANARYGTDHGFSVPITRAAGPITVCAIATNVGLGSTRTIACRSMTVSFNPHGSFDSVTQIPGGLTVIGGASDPNATGPIAVNVFVDGVKQARVIASDPGHHGHAFHATVMEPAGSHSVCIQALNVGPGTHVWLGCKTITLNFSPSGAVTSLAQANGGIHITGWAQDPDTTGAIQVYITANGVKAGMPTARLSTPAHPNHAFDSTYTLDNGQLAPGTYQICATAMNYGTYGTDTSLGCQSITLNFNPTSGIESATQIRTGIRVRGWATDPDTSAPINTQITLDGQLRTTVLANGTGARHDLHNFFADITTGPGPHTVCAVGVNVMYGTGNSGPACTTITLHYDPVGGIDSTTRVRVTHQIVVKGWALDPNTAAPIKVQIFLNGTKVGGGAAQINHPSTATAYPGFGGDHGFAITVPSNANEQRVCVTALNVGYGTDRSIGCVVVNAVHPTTPSAPSAVQAQGGYGTATVTWTAPASDGGAPWSGYKIVSTDGRHSVTTSASSTSAVVTGLSANHAYRFTVFAINMMGGGAAGMSNTIHTKATPPAQTTPAPISTSRYVRNVHGATSGSLAAMRSEGATDAAHNPSGHRYMVLLDIGGQDQQDGGVVLSAGVRFVSYGDLVSDINAYVDGYASTQQSMAPVVIAIGTNNDMDVTMGSGATWANNVVDQVVAHAAKYPNMTIAGANDIEPGFTASYGATKNWLAGYLANTSAPFVFNGSADGCNWSQVNGGCNNGWSAAGLYYLSAGAAPSRMISLPQIYNTTMAKQWKYISLTGMTRGQPRVNFGGPLTEYTACQQAGSCSSLGGNAAWSALWGQLQSVPQLAPGSLPYSTDLRIDS